MEAQGIFGSGDGTVGNVGDEACIVGGGKSVVVSIVENRAREICLAKVDTSNVSNLN